MANILISDIDAKVQLRLRNVVNSPLSQATRYSAYNDVIDFLQSVANWEFSKRVAPFEYLNREPDYSLANNLLVTDFKQFKELRFIDDQTVRNLKEFEEIEPSKITIALGQNRFNNELCFESRDNDTIMRILSDFGQGDSIIDDTGDLTTGRTWASDTTLSDATTLSADTTRVKVGGGSLLFNITPGQSVNDFARIYTSSPFTSPIDASAIVNFGAFRLWLGLHNVSAANLALITSVTFIWGSDSNVTPSTKAHYWSATVTSSATGGAFKPTWNRMSFNWANATKTGSPDESALTYFEIQITYSNGFTSSLNIRVDQIQMFDPQEMELVYFSNNFVLSGTTQQQYLTTTPNVVVTEYLMLPSQHKNLFMNLALKILFPQKERQTDDYARVMKEIETDLPLAIDMSGESVTREEREFQVDGSSSGRDDLTNNQW